MADNGRKLVTVSMPQKTVDQIEILMKMLVRSKSNLIQYLVQEEYTRRTGESTNEEE